MGSGPRETKSYLDVLSFMSGMLTELSPEPPQLPSLGWGLWVPIWHVGMGSGCAALRGSGEGGRQRALALLLPALSSAAVPRLCGGGTRVAVRRASTIQCSVLCHPSPGLLFHFFL